MATSPSPGRNGPTGCVVHLHLAACVFGIAAAVSLAAPAGAAGDCGAIRSDCRSAGTSILLVKNPTGDHDKLTWRWLNGAATTVPDFGNPTTTTQYALCVFAGTAAGVISEVDVAPSSTLWTAQGTKGFRYSDPARTSAGIEQVRLTAGEDGKAKALLKGKGVDLPDPPAGPFALPVTVQLINSSTSVCFEGVYSTGDVLKNDAEQFKAKVRITCGDHITEGSEQCDGSDDAACPGECLANCTCRVPCGSSAPACSGGCPPGQSCGVDAPCACGPANPTACGGSAPMCNGTCPAGESCAADPLVGDCYCVSFASTPCANSLGSFPICGGVCPVGTNCVHVPASYCACL